MTIAAAIRFVLDRFHALDPDGSGASAGKP